MANPAAKQRFNRPASAKAKRAITTAEVEYPAAGQTPAVAVKPRQIHKAGEVNISAYFPAEVKASLRMVQAKTGYNVKDCLAEALRDLFRKHNVPISVDLGEGR